MSECKQELCENWGGDGNVCNCSLFGIEPTRCNHPDCPCQDEKGDTDG